MPTLTNPDDEARAGLTQLGAQHGRSMNGEVRTVPADPVRARQAARSVSGLGSRIHQLFADLDWQGVERPDGPAEAASFERS